MIRLAFAQLIASWAICFGIGYGASGWLLPRRWAADRVSLAPLLGAAMLALLCSWFSYAGVPIRAAAPLVLGIGAALSAAGIVVARQRRFTRPRLLFPLCVALVGLIGAAGVMVSLVLFRAWNPYTDAFTYVSIADYLVTHSFMTPAVPGAYEPVLTQMKLYQSGFRIGSTFLLAFFSALFRADLSFDVYLPVLALGLWLGVIGFWVLCRRVLFMTKTAAAVAVVIYALHTVPITNAMWGFMPQAWGMAFMYLALPLVIRAPGRRERYRRWTVAGLATAATLLTYTEIIPFAIAAIGLGYLIRLLFGRLPFREALTAGAAAIAIAVAFTPVISARFIPILRLQSGAVVGWDVGLSASDYLLLLAGFRSFVTAAVDDPWVAPALILSMRRVMAIGAILTLGYGAIRSPRRVRRQLAWVAAPFVLGFVWFAMFAANPFTAGAHGQPWSTYKMVTYGFFVVAVLWGIGVTRLWRDGAVFRAVVVAQASMIALVWPAVASATARFASTGMKAITGNERDPIGEYKKVPSLVADLPVDMPVNLVVPFDSGRKLFAYFLQRPVIADWSDDVYIWPHLEPEYRHLDLDRRYTTLVNAPFDQPGAANLKLYPRDSIIPRDVGAGWFGQERDATGAWRWLEKTGELDVDVPANGTVAMKAEVAVIGAPTRRVTLSVAGQPQLSVSQELQERWFTPFVSQGLPLTAGRHRLVLAVDGPVNAMSATDGRRVRIGVRNLRWTFTPD